MLLCIHSVDIEMFDLHELILCVFGDDLSVLLYIHIDCIEMLDLHELILYVLLVNYSSYF